MSIFKKKKNTNTTNWPPPNEPINTQTHLTNPYAKLEEAQRVFLNPTFNQIQEQIDLTTCCYYRLKKYPKGRSAFWTLLADRDFDQLAVFLTDEESEPHLLANLLLANQVQDANYLRYLAQKRPLSKLHLKISPKNHRLPDHLKDILKLPANETIQNPDLKMALHAYIAEQDLQVNRLVTLDLILLEVLEEDLSDHYKVGQTISYWDIWRAFQAKFH